MQKHSTLASIQSDAKSAILAAKDRSLNGFLFAIADAVAAMSFNHVAVSDVFE
jgi:hypothetical protein